MRSQDGERLSACLMAIADVYGRALSEAVVGVWFRALRSYDIAPVEDAFARHVNSPDVGQFMPKPADIVRMLEGSSEDAALVAWTNVDRAVRHVGSYQSVAFDDAIIHRVVHDMGGWVGIGTKTESEWPFVANEFRNRYRGYRSQGVIPPYPPHLMGIVEGENSRRAITGAVQPIVFIGDIERAQAVVRGGQTQPMIGFTQASAAMSQLPHFSGTQGKPQLTTVQ